MALTTEIEKLLNEVRRLYNHIYHVGETLHADEPITIAMRAVLEFLQRNGPATVPDIARSRSVTRQHIQMIVNSLRDEALVKLEPNPRHKRSSIVALTPEGERTINRMLQRETLLLDDARFDATRDEIRAAAKTIEKVRRSINPKEKKQ